MGGQRSLPIGSILLRYGLDGVFDWSWNPTSSGGLRMTDIAAAPSGRLYHCGHLASSASFGSILVPAFGTTDNAYVTLLDLVSSAFTTVPPTWFAPRLVALPADSGNHPQLLRLSDYVADDQTPASQLIFRLVSGSTLPGLSVSVAPDGVVSAVLAAGTAGMTQITVAAKDGDDNESEATLTLLVVDTTAAPSAQWQGLR